MAKIFVLWFFVVVSTAALNIIDPHDPDKYIVGGNDASPEQ